MCVQIFSIKIKVSKYYYIYTCVHTHLYCKQSSWYANIAKNSDRTYD